MSNTQSNTPDIRLFTFVFLASCTVVLSALGFEHIGGYQPCKLCLEQRGPWYMAIPIAAIALLSVAFKWPDRVSRGAIAIVGVLMLYSLVLAIRHSGVEWQWWEGPSDCGAVEGGISTSTGGLLDQLETTLPPSCNEAAARFLGLSFAGWNAVASLVLAIVSLKAAYGSSSVSQ